MLEQLKKESLKKVSTKILCYLGICIILVGIFHKSFINLIEGPKDFETLSIEELPKSYVNGEFQFLVDNFAQYYVENDSGEQNVTENYYIIPVGEEEYMALGIDASDSDEANSICEQTYQYLMGTTDAPPAGIQLTGTINEMSDEVYNYYDDWFRTSGFLGDPTKEDIEKVALPYILQVDYIGFAANYIVYGAIIILILGFLSSIVILIKALTGLYVAPIKKYIQKNESTISLEQMELDFMHATTINSFRIGQVWTYYFKGNKVQVIKNEDIIWTYLHETTRKVYGIKAAVIRILVLYTKDKKKHTYAMRNVNDIYTVLGEYSKNHPNIVVGFSDDLNDCFNHDFESFGKIASEIQIAVTNESNVEIGTKTKTEAEINPEI